MGFEVFELVFNVLFTVELVINMYAHWFWLFWFSSWNVFDVVVVSIGVITTMKIELPPGFSLLRMVRAFRVFRLFRRVHSLNKIIVSIVHAIPGMMNAFLILAIIMSIYGILAVEFYRSIGVGCLDLRSDVAWLTTAREVCWGFEYFGTFLNSLYTFFQVMTGESWSEAVARPAIWAFQGDNAGDQVRSSSGGGYFVSFFIITAFVMTNVVVAVLLDKMVDPDVAAAAQAAHPDHEPSPVQTTNDMNNAIAALESEIDELLANSDGVQSAISNLSGEMAFVREQVAMLGTKLMATA